MLFLSYSPVEICKSLHMQNAFKNVNVRTYQSSLHNFRPFIPTPNMQSVKVTLSGWISLWPGIDFINCFAPLRPTFAPCAQLLRSFLLAQKLGARCKRWAQGAKPFMKWTPGVIFWRYVTLYNLVLWIPRSDPAWKLYFESRFEIHQGYSLLYLYSIFNFAIKTVLEVENVTC